MLEMKITIEAAELAAAVEKLADAIRGNPNFLPLDPPQIQTPVPAAPVSASVAVPTQPPTMPVPTPPPTSVPTAPAPALPVASAPSYTLDQISKAGAALVDAGKMDPLLALLTKYGVQAITQLPPAQYGAFATELRTLGAQL